MLNELRLPAIEVTQSRKRKLYSFAVDGKLVHDFATISRVSRQQDGHLTGYQRPEMLSHIEEIRNYIESQSPMIPNAVILAFDKRVRFEPAAGAPASNYSRIGTLVIPLDKSLADEHKPGFIVDGQQRLAAIREADISKFPICVTAFITDDLKQQMEQFILVNSTKPLSKALIYELIPKTEAQLPSALYRRKLPALLLERLNLDVASPLRGMIHTTTNPQGHIKDNSILKMLEHSLSDGALHRFRHSGSLEGDTASMLKLLHNYWHAVSTVFHAAWDLPPKKSRLMHGVGIVSMGLLMDSITDRILQAGEASRIPTREQYEADLSPLRNLCHWTAGTWTFGPQLRRKWNELQNTPKDITLLADWLLEEYQRRVWNQKMPVERAG
jgi:DGQHR domain-containing protein